MDKILHGDSLELLKDLDDNSVDSIVTDPPYGYDFMGKDWDKAVPSVELWEECLRVLKPGSFAFIMSAPRSDVQGEMIKRLEKAGFRVDFTPVYWTYATGFPKAMNIGKMVDKREGKERKVVGQRKDILEKQAKDLERGYRKIKDSYDKGAPERNNGFKTVSADITEPASDKAKELDGSYAGYQPKPAVEVVIVVMKPLSEKSYVDQAMKNGKGVTWLDDARIPFSGMDDLETWDYNMRGASERTPDIEVGTTMSEEYGNPEHKWGYKKQKPIPKLKTTNRKPREEGTVFKTSGFKSENNDTAEASPMGRFPANLLVSDDVLDDGKKRKAVPKGGFGAMDIGIGKPGETQKYRKKKMTMPDLRDVGKKSKEAIGIDKLSFGQVENAERKEYEVWDIQEESIGYSRFFSLDEWFKKNINQLPEPVQKTFPFLIVPKASKSEKNDGLELMEEKKSGAYVGRGGTQEDPNGMFKDRDSKSRNIHPTVKPLTLMNYLVTLGSRKGDVVLDPFMGSGTTPLACISLERKYIGIDNEEDYYKIAKARVDKLEAPIKAWEKFL